MTRPTRPPTPSRPHGPLPGEPAAGRLLVWSVVLLAALVAALIVVSYPVLAATGLAGFALGSLLVWTSRHDADVVAAGRSLCAACESSAAECRAVSRSR